MITNYIETGKASLEFRDYAFGGQESLDAAAASDCALDQGKFWQYHDTLFLNQHGENQGAFSRTRLKQMAKDLGLNTTEFNQCLDSGKHATDVSNSTQQAIKDGFPGTPAFTVNGTTVNYTNPQSVTAAVEAALKGQ